MPIEAPTGTKPTPEAGKKGKAKGKAGEQSNVVQQAKVLKAQPVQPVVSGQAEGVQYIIDQMTKGAAKQGLEVRRKPGVDDVLEVRDNGTTIYEVDLKIHPSSASIKQIRKL